MVGIIVALYTLICAIDLLGFGFAAIGGSQAEMLFGFVSNPFSGLILGILTTALIQSSSTVTTLIVAMVATGLPVGVAIPMVMGANIGTTITNTLVSLGYVSDDDSFERAFAAATIHDFFNLIAVTIFLPLELILHPLEQLSALLSQILSQSLTVFVTSPVVQPLVNLNLTNLALFPMQWSMIRLVNWLPGPWDTLLIFSLGIGCLMVAITALGWLLKQLLVGKAEQMLHQIAGRGSALGLLTGFGVTAVVQSSSLTTSLMVPLAGTGLLSLQEVYPIILGANIGTCATALIAALGLGEVTALQIAIVHLLFNVLAVLVIFGLPWLRQRPVQAAQWLAALATKRRWLAIVYVLLVFFGIPSGLLALTFAL
jgi:solute carrier family 34 (sodium-dependent phosphate cotransporter)